MMKKLRSRRGESLVEMLVSIAILGLSITLMLTMIMVSSRMTTRAREKDAEILEDLKYVEERPDDGKNANVIIEWTNSPSGTSKITLPVKYYQNGDSSLISYIPEP